MPSETNPRARIRLYAFYGAVIIGIALPLITASWIYQLVVTAWAGSTGSHSAHVLVIVASMWTALLGLAVQFYRPTERVNAILLTPLWMFPSAAIGFAIGNEVVTERAIGGVILGVLGLVALVLHPAGRSVLRFDRVESPNRLLVGLFAVGAVFLVVYGSFELVKQFTLTDEHAAVQHYGNHAVSVFLTAVLGGLAVFRRRDWRFATWMTGFVALYLGVGSAVFPDTGSSLGLVGGVVVAVWAITFIAMTERVRGAQIDESGGIEETAGRTG
jgi:hypothetical protein